MKRHPSPVSESSEEDEMVRFQKDYLPVINHLISKRVSEISDEKDHDVMCPSFDISTISKSDDQDVAMVAVRALTIEVLARQRVLMQRQVQCERALASTEHCLLNYPLLQPLGEQEYHIEMRDTMRRLIDAKIIPIQSSDLTRSLIRHLKEQKGRDEESVSESRLTCFLCENPFEGEPMITHKIQATDSRGCGRFYHLGCLMSWILLSEALHDSMKSWNCPACGTGFFITQGPYNLRKLNPNKT